MQDDEALPPPEPDTKKEYNPPQLVIFNMNSTKSGSLGFVESSNFNGLIS